MLKSIRTGGRGPHGIQYDSGRGPLVLGTLLVRSVEEDLGPYGRYGRDPIGTIGPLSRNNCDGHKHLGFT